MNKQIVDFSSLFVLLINDTLIPHNAQQRVTYKQTKSNST